jgi:hypothetical protein
MAVPIWLGVVKFVALVDFDLVSCEVGFIVDLLVCVEYMSVFYNGVGSCLFPMPAAMVVVGWYEQSKWCFQSCYDQTAAFRK